MLAIVQLRLVSLSSCASKTIKLVQTQTLNSLPPVPKVMRVSYRVFAGFNLRFKNGAQLILTPHLVLIISILTPSNDRNYLHSFAVCFHFFFLFQKIQLCSKVYIPWPIIYDFFCPFFREYEMITKTFLWFSWLVLE